MKVKISIDETLTRLLEIADKDNDRKITVDDPGEKVFELVSVNGEKYEITGTYYLSNLLQELILLKEEGVIVGEIDSEFIFEKPVARINRMIRNKYWEGLTRVLDKKGIEKSLIDDKIISNELKPILYVPAKDDESFKYYEELSNSLDNRFIVERLEEELSPEYVKKLNKKPGILALSIKKDKNGQIQAEPFVVPGGRFNEMYGWDSYFIVLGLIEDNKIELAKSMVNHMVYEINHYGKILNANRSYYLTRSQPPFFTSMLLAVIENLELNEENITWLEKGLKAAIKEYNDVWMKEPRLTSNGLSRYYGEGIGIPPETEPGHFDYVFEKYAKKRGLTIDRFAEKYDTGDVIEPELDAFLIHDRSLRESGHDTTYRLINISASLNTIDLNSLLYKYEIDIQFIIEKYFNGSFKYSDKISYTSDEWAKKSEKRKLLMNKLMWNEEKGSYFDYNFKTSSVTNYESATAFYAMWSGLADEKQANRMVEELLPKLEAPGGLLSTSEESRGIISQNRPQRQWDYPFGWAPHQIILWEALSRYGFQEIREKFIYRWLYTIVKNATHYNGTIPEKFDVVKRTHKVFAEYGNEGTDFDYITREGFGWVNASFQIGVKLLNHNNVEKLNNLIPPEWIF